MRVLRQRPLQIEKDIYVELSPRQRSLYKALLANVSVQDLLEKAANMGDADSARSLMNLVMQFRKVCNHPELFQRAEVKSALSVSQWARSGNLAREGDFLLLPYSTRNPIDYVIPKLFYEDGGLLDIPHETGPKGFETRWLHNLMNIWSGDWMHRSLYDTPSKSVTLTAIFKTLVTPEKNTYSTLTSAKPRDSRSGEMPLGSRTT